MFQSRVALLVWHRVPVGVISTVKSRELLRESERRSENHASQGLTIPGPSYGTRGQGSTESDLLGMM